MLAAIRFEDGTLLSIKDVVIPPTDVRKIGFLHWLVDACKGSGSARDFQGNFQSNIVVELPPEDVVWQWGKFGIVALAIDCPTRLILADDGSVWTGSVRFPDCKLSLTSMEAEAVTAAGTLTREGGS